MKSGVCPKCGAAKIVANVLVQAGVGAIARVPEAGKLVARLEQPADPEKWIQSVRTEQWTFHAWVCGSCGYTEFYADDPATFYEAYEQGWR